MATTTAQGSGSTNNNGGSLIKAGNPATDSPISRNVTLVELADDKGESFGSKVVANDGTGAATTDRAGVAKAVSGGTLAFTPDATQWVMRGGNVSTTLGGVANTTLVGGARDYSGAINDDATTVAKTKISDRLVGSMSDVAFDVYAAPSTQIVPGRTKGTGAGNALAFVNPADGTAAVAAEIAPSDAVPGELTYHFGELARATTDEYKAKNVYES
jgi:hypothetical protein